MWGLEEQSSAVLSTGCLRKSGDLAGEDEHSWLERGVEGEASEEMHGNEQDEETDDEEEEEEEESMDDEDIDEEDEMANEEDEVEVDAVADDETVVADEEAVSEAAVEEIAGSSTRVDRLEREREKVGEDGE